MLHCLGGGGGRLKAEHKNFEPSWIFLSKCSTAEHPCMVKIVIKCQTWSDSPLFKMVTNGLYNDKPNPPTPPPPPQRLNNPWKMTASTSYYNVKPLKNLQTCKLKLTTKGDCFLIPIQALSQSKKLIQAWSRSIWLTFKVIIPVAHLVFWWRLRFPWLLENNPDVPGHNLISFLVWLSHQYSLLRIFFSRFLER